jgi:sorting nexin-25
LENKYFPGFKKSDLYYKYLTSDEAAAGPVLPPIAQSMSPISPISPIESKRVNPMVRDNSQPRIMAPIMARTSSQPSKKPSDLRRVAASSTDIRSSAKALEEPNKTRRSLDTDGRAPLFDDDYDTDPLANSTYSLGKDSQPDESKEAKEQTEVVEAMEAALNDIITNDPQSDKEEDKEDKPDDKSDEHSFLFGSPNSSHRSGRGTDSPRGSLEFTRMNSTGEKFKPSIASLGLVNTSGRIGVFSDDDLFPDEEKFIEDEYADEDNNAQGPDPSEEIHEAAPGDLGLAEAISVLTADIERLIAQDSIVDTLTKKAELTNNAAELRILQKSKSSLQREIRRKELQRQQYIIQESDNSLYGRSSIKIKSIMVGKEDDGREFALCMFLAFLECSR